MYDYVRNSLYEVQGTDEMEQLRDEVEGEIIKDEVNGYNNKLNSSIELEQYYLDKLKEVSKLIVELKEKSQELTDLKAARDSLNKEYKANPKNKEVKEQALDVEEEYKYQLDNFVDRITEVLKIDLSEVVSKHEIEHSKLILVLKEYRLKLKEEIETQKLGREKIISVMEKGLNNKFDSKLGMEVSNILREEISSYNATMQQELRKRGLQNTEEVFLRLKILTAMYGYKKVDLTPDFIQREMETIKSKVKLYMPIYRSIRDNLKKISKSKISEMKLVFISEAKENVELEMSKLEERKTELEDLLQRDKEHRDVEELRTQNRKRKMEISELNNAKRICLENKDKDEVAKDIEKIEDEINKKKEEIDKNDKKIQELTQTKQQVVMLSGLGALLGLGGLQFIPASDESKEAVAGEDKIDIINDDGVEATDEERLEIEDEEEIEVENEVEDIEDDIEHDDEYTPLEAEEIKDMRDELRKIKEDLKKLKEKSDKLNDVIESTKSVVEKYEDLKEEHEEKKNDIIDELEKYDIFKDLTEAFGRSKNASYEYLYI